MKQIKVIRKLQLFVLVCATVCFAVALVFSDLTCQETLIDVSVVMLLAVQLMTCIIKKRGKKDGEDESESK